MQVISLNIWGGRHCQPLLDFLQMHQEVDVFCLQEVYHNATKQISDEKEALYTLDIFSRLTEQLPGHQGFFSPVVGSEYGIAMFVKKTLKVVEEGAVPIYENPAYLGQGPAHSRMMQWAKMQDSKGNSFSILNVHGLWNGEGKSDSPERLQQSKRIKKFVSSLDTSVILCGDFNLLPDTESLKLIETKLKNLIRAYQVQSTRTSFYSKPERFADYILTSPHLNVKAFQVLKDEVSDHSPLHLEIEMEASS